MSLAVRKMVCGAPRAISTPPSSQVETGGMYMGQPGNMMGQPGNMMGQPPMGEGPILDPEAPPFYVFAVVEVNPTLADITNLQQRNLTLLKQGERAPATIRGLVKSAAGKPVKAQVRISEVSLNVPVKADGRFVVQVPGGKYTLTIEAAGYVTQVKTVEVADGDQAIFHCDLQPAGR